MPRITYSWLRNKSFDCDTLVKDLKKQNNIKDSLYKNEILKNKACMLIVKQKDSTNNFYFEEIKITRSLAEKSIKENNFFSNFKSPIPWLCFSLGSFATLLIVKYK